MAMPLRIKKNQVIPGSVPFSPTARELTRIRECLIEASEAAGSVLLRYFRKKGLKISEKKGAGLVTQADCEAQDRAVALLRKAYPDFGFLTEESPPEEGRSPGRWIIDPLDGTSNFVHGFPMFCVSLAFEWQGEVLAGVIYHPILKERYVAIAGRGAFCNGKRISVSETRRIQDALLTTGFTYQHKRFLNREIELFQTLSGLARAIRRPGSAALDLAYTARGVFDGFWEKNLSPWDVAAGVLLVKEAGGRVSDFSGRPFSFQQPEILACNAPLHSVLVRHLKSS
jgi:myo-inositol-1(or 4)-monophosphatase